MTAVENGEFWLWDLRVDVVGSDDDMVCNHPSGAFFLVEGESLVMGTQRHFPLFALAAILPLLPAKQRATDDADWMTTDGEVACPDPHCGGRFRISRTKRRKFRHAETTGLPDARSEPYWKSGGTARD